MILFPFFFSPVQPLRGMLLIQAIAPVISKMASIEFRTPWATGLFAFKVSGFCCTFVERNFLNEIIVFLADYRSFLLLNQSYDSVFSVAVNFMVSLTSILDVRRIQGNRFKTCQPVNILCPIFSASAFIFSRNCTVSKITSIERPFHPYTCYFL